MKLSVVAVNNNQCKLLKQSLVSVITAATDIAHEIMVLDNASADGSAGMLQKDFPEVVLLQNEKKESYAKAANRIIEAAKGEFILLLNPSIVLSPDTLKKTLGFMEAHLQTGALGVRMINGTGRFLPESKHGLPLAWVKFFKYLFLFRFFPKLRLANHRAAAQWTDEFDSTEVDVLCRDFTLFRKSALAETGVFDERFAEYGSDVDLSYRIRLAGYKNYYFAKTHVVNYSTGHPNKLSWNYIKNFYGAMLMFAFKYLLKMPAISLSAGKPAPAHLYEFER